MIKKKGGQLNTDGTEHYKERTKNSKRKNKMRKTLESTKSSRALHNMYHEVVLPDKPLYYIENMDDPEEAQEVYDWWATNVIDILSEISSMYVTVSENNDEWLDLVATAALDKERGYPPGISYRCKLDLHSEPELVAVDKYIEFVLDWVDAQIGNEKIFPVDEDAEFPPSFPRHASKIFTRLFRVYHIVFSNECLFSKMGQDHTFEVTFRHFLYFGWKWKLLKESATRAMEHIVPTIRKKFLRDESQYLKKDLPKR